MYYMYMFNLYLYQYRERESESERAVKSDRTKQNLFMAPCSTGSVPWQLRCNGHQWNKPRKWKKMAPASNGLTGCTGVHHTATSH